MLRHGSPNASTTNEDLLDAPRDLPLLGATYYYIQRQTAPVQVTIEVQLDQPGQTRQTEAESANRGRLGKPRQNGQTEAEWAKAADATSQLSKGFYGIEA